MITISLCMIVKNEEDVLKRCLESAKDLVDEIILVDTGSDDTTKEIAGRFTEKIYDYVWKDDFAHARNYAFSKATMEYCLWLDADDVILKEDQERFLEMKSKMTGREDVMMLPYHTALDEKGRPTFIYYRERIVRNCSLFRWEGEVHECITPSGIILYEDAAVTHDKIKPADPNRNLRILEKIIESGMQVLPRQRFYYGQELYFHQRYKDAIKVLSAFLDDENGWVENKLEACKILSDCYLQINENEHALQALLKSLELDAPRAELCCQLGGYFLDRGRYHQAVFWYETARTREPDMKRGGFVQADCYGYIPNMQLTVCYDRMGEWERASQYNEQAAIFKPESEAVEYNRNYFKNKRGIFNEI